MISYDVLPSGKLTLLHSDFENCHRNSCFTHFFSMVIVHSYVSSPEGIHQKWQWGLNYMIVYSKNEEPYAEE